MTETEKKKPRGKPFVKGEDQRRRLPDDGKVYAAGDACPRCQAEGRAGRMQERKGQYGTFLGCDAFPLCRFARSPKSGAEHSKHDMKPEGFQKGKGQGSGQSTEGEQGSGQSTETEQGEEQGAETEQGEESEREHKSVESETERQQREDKEREDRDGKPRDMQRTLEDRMRIIAREEDAKLAKRVDVWGSAHFADLRADMARIAKQYAENGGGSMSIELQSTDGTTKKVKVKTGTDVLARLLRAKQVGYPALMVGPAGCGKTTYARLLAEMIYGEGWLARFGTLSCTTGMTEGHVRGRGIPLISGEGGLRYMQSEAVRIGEAGGVFLFDEIDGADPNVLLVLQQLFSHGVLPLPERPEHPYMTMHPDAFYCAAANTYGAGATRIYAGRNQLDAATLDRFIVIPVDYSRPYEESIIPNDGATKGLVAQWWQMRHRADALGLRVVLSTRGLQRIAKATAQGLTLDHALGEELAKYPADVRAKLTSSQGV